MHYTPKFDLTNYDDVRNHSTIHERKAFWAAHARQTLPKMKTGTQSRYSPTVAEV